MIPTPLYYWRKRSPWPYIIAIVLLMAVVLIWQGGK